MNPTLTHDECLALLAKNGVTDKVAWIGLRWKGSVYGEKDAYTDTAILVTPDGIQVFKFNTLPTAWSQDIACLVPGTYRWRKGLHGLHHLNLNQNKDGSYQAPDDQAAYEWLLAHVGEAHPNPKYALIYWAFREVPPMTVIRNGHTGLQTDSAAAPFWIDGHHGGANTTSSAACQTWPLALWHTAQQAGYAAMDQYGQETIAYHLELVD